ncbi:LOW QUALITY PROTEIN: hypothetical protein DH2020_032467 [Rehmannia glutinosa]|uniref:C2H2-type domain-containing protein n=1 Tax=Rehmannia glutinosa TaxID=99300 RepID=A0ABR0VHD8_REHGL
MDEDQELRFVCKLCNKKYPCGKSLGGHMRSHVVANSAEFEEKFEKKISSLVNYESKIVNYENGQSSYGLRENPRKTWRATDSSFPFPQEKICKQCGKGFQSLKALCGHMACHSDRDKGLRDDHSWSTSENQKLVVDSHSDTEDEDLILPKNKKFKKIVVKSTTNNGSSSVSEIDGDEQEEVAMCLMLLSRDLGNKGGVNSVVESSDNNSVILETKSSSIDMKTGNMEVVKNVDNQNEVGKKLDVEIAQNSDSGYFLDECAKAYESDASVDGFRRNGAFSQFNKHTEFMQSLNRSKNYRAEVKRELAKEFDYDNNNGVMAQNSARIESRKRRYISENPEVCNVSQKRTKYECFNCKKTFKSYQALGGHRPCHKRTNAYYESRYESGENSLDDSTEFVTTGKIVESTSNRKSSAKCAEKKIKSKKNKGHVCPFCNRVFKNGQALGGHKRSHFIGGHDENNNRSPNNNRNPVVKRDLIDLNLPAPQEDEDDENERFLDDF